MTEQTSGPGTPGARSGRPRRAEVSERILRATRDALADRGYAGLRVDDIAARAAVAKTTLYRRWPSKTALVVDAVGASLADLPELTADDLGADVRRVVAWFAGRLGDPDVRAGLLGLLAEAPHNPALQDSLRTRLRDPHLSLVRSRLRSGVRRGEVRHGIPVELVYDVLVGTLLHHCMFAAKPMNADYLEAFVTMLHQYVHQTPRSPVARPASEAE